MTRADLIARLTEIARQYRHDPEVAHGLADDALIEFINDSEIEAAYALVEKWYG